MKIRVNATSPTSSLKSKQAFWVTNSSSMQVSLADLGCSIPAFETVNLLDFRRYGLTLQQLENSASSGSLYKKQRRIKIRRNSPQPTISNPITMQADPILPHKERSTENITERHFEELEVKTEVSDKEVEDSADLADL